MAVRLYVRPKRAPKWWPRQGRKIVWVGLLSNGIGWVVGDGDVMTEKHAKLAKAAFLEDQRDEHGRRTAFEFKKVKR